jgi:hypothetical protein
MAGRVRVIALVITYHLVDFPAQFTRAPGFLNWR